jgi:hypothetical protein
MSKNSESAVEQNIPAVEVGTEVNRTAKANLSKVETPETDTLKPNAYDPFDPDNMRLSQATLKGAAKKLVTNYVIRKPRKGAFFRVHPGEDYQYVTYVYVEKDEAQLEKDTYLISHRFSAQLDEEFKSVMQGVILYLAKERHAEKPFVWRVGIPLEGAKDNKYWESAREIADIAKTEWVRIATSMGCYEHYKPTLTTGIVPEPVWPEIPFGEILRLAFKNRVIDSMDHPIMRALTHLED